jgi:hypothetical protein
MKKLSCKWQVILFSTISLPVSPVENGLYRSRDRFLPLRSIDGKLNPQGTGRSGIQSPLFSTLMKASCGMFTLPNIFIFFFPSFCFSKSLRFREMSPP